MRCLIIVHEPVSLEMIAAKNYSLYNRIIYMFEKSLKENF